MKTRILKILMSIILYTLVTLGCLVLQQRYQRRHPATTYEYLRSNAENSTVQSNERVVDVEDLVSPLINSPV